MATTMTTTDFEREIVEAADLLRAIEADPAVARVAQEWVDGDVSLKDLMNFAAGRGHEFAPAWPERAG